MLTFQNTRRWLLALAVAILVAATVVSLPVVVDDPVGIPHTSPALAGDHEGGGCG